MWRVVSSLALCASLASGAERYRAIQVSRFAVADQVAIPPDYMLALDMELLDQLRRIKHCELAVREGTPATLPRPALRLTGLVSEFKPRGGMLRGVNEIVARLRFLDAQTGEVLHEADVKGKLVYGVVSGDMEHATRGLAKKIAEVAHDRFFR